MRQLFITRAAIEEFITGLNKRYGKTGLLYLVGETTRVCEGWWKWTEQVEFCVEISPADRLNFEEALQQVLAESGIPVLEEFPGDIIPLPEGYRDRARKAELSPGESSGSLRICHFDPYSVAFRFIARGDETDYHLALDYLQHGWITEEKMIAMLSELLPRFTCETLQQDPAEFRRKFKGLLQLWRAKQGV